MNWVTGVQKPYLKAKENNKILINIFCKKDNIKNQKRRLS